MKPAPFDYLRPATLDDAVAALAGEGRSAAALAGGQSLLVLLGLRVAAFDLLVDIGRLPELKAVREDAKGVFIGAGVTHSAIEDHAVPDPSNGLMPRVASAIAYRAVRHQGTIGGAVALADPAADWPPCLVALGAVAVIRGPDGTRRERVADLVQGLYATTLGPGEIILGFEIPRLPPAARWGVAKVARKSGAYATSIAIALDFGDDGAPTVVLGATSTRPQTMAQTQGALAARGEPSDADLRAAIARDLDVVEPDGDAYVRRTHTATVLRALREARLR